MIKSNKAVETPCELATRIKNNIQDFQIELPDEYFYSCFPLCLIDAIFSIGARYRSTQNAVKRFATKENIKTDRRISGYQDYTTDKLLCTISFHGLENFAENYTNRQRTSTRSGILKAKAVQKAGELCQEIGIQTIDDFNRVVNSTSEFEEKFLQIKGQSSGISFQYLKMLCGDENTIKPDRQIMRFLEIDLVNQESREKASKLIEQTVEIMRKWHGMEKLTPRILDYNIWNYMRQKNK